MTVSDKIRNAIIQPINDGDLALLPTKNVKDFVNLAASSHHIVSSHSRLDAWAEAVTRAAGDSVQLDQVGQLLVALFKARRINGRQMARLMSNYLLEKDGLHCAPPHRKHAMFDPFGDAATQGYLRNVEGLAASGMIKVQEHLFFSANLEQALAYLAAQRSRDISYATFLHVHKILFSDFYPWAGQDREALGVGKHVTKGTRVQFEQSDLSRRAVEYGLRLASDADAMRKKPGTVMGYFAWGHPFLDGNGRTMLLVHTELCRRAGFAIDWERSAGNSYLEALTAELSAPDKGILDKFFAPLACALDDLQHPHYTLET
ncbi:Fic family protein [Janthinobacterium sp. LB2P49]|uniref:Fic family protein n=1 Tax=Janthinobacterium sp. LB2P49 TaxID=3424198 RepID=UPI003F291675